MGNPIVTHAGVLTHNLEHFARRLKMLPEMIIALTLYAEAGNQGQQGILLVASVISQRAENSGKSPAEECQKPKQFSCWNKGAPDVPAWNESWEFCRAIARRMANGEKFGQGYTHYHTRKILPYWAKKANFSLPYGDHIFYRKEWLRA